MAYNKRFVKNINHQKALFSGMNHEVDICSRRNTRDEIVCTRVTNSWIIVGFILFFIGLHAIKIETKHGKAEK